MGRSALSLAIVAALVNSSLSFEVARTWLNAFNTVIRNPSNFAPPAQSANRYLAFASVAIFETYQFFESASGRSTSPAAVLSPLDYPKTAPYNVTADVRAANVDLAASAAAHLVMSVFFPLHKEQIYPQFDSILTSHLNELGVSTNSPVALASLRLGTWVGRIIIGDHRFDGFQSYKHFSNNASATHGVYRFTQGQAFVIYPGLRDSRGWVIARSNETIFRISNSSVLSYNTSTNAYKDQLAYVREYGKSTSTVRTQDQTNLAYFWRLGAGTPTVPGVYTQIATELATRKSLSNHQTAKLFALLHTAAIDANGAGWNNKFVHSRWRPESGVRYAATPAVGTGPNAGDEAWSPLLANPPHPEFPSTHAVACAAASAVLAKFFGSDTIDPPLVLYSEDTTGAAGTGTGLAGPLPPRTYGKLSDIAFECGISRIYAGLHFNFSVDAGLALGKTVGEFVYAQYPGNISARVSKVAAYATATGPTDSAASAALSALVAVASLVVAVALF